MMTTTSRLLLFLIPLLVVTVILLPKVRAKHPTWDLLANNNSSDSAIEYIQQLDPRSRLFRNVNSTTLENDIVLEIRELDSKRHLLWNTSRRTSSTLIRRAIVKIMNKELTRWDYLNSRFDMIGLFLFGPEKYRSTLSTVRGKEPIVVDLRCFKSTLELFEKHCGLLPELGSRHVRALANICNYVAEKAAIKEAIIVSCVMTKPEIYGIDVRNPSVQATPAPVPGSRNNYCARIFVNGTSRSNLGSYARPYRILLALSRKVHHIMHDKVQICFHRDASLGLCECGNDEWRSLQNGTWSVVTSPYVTNYIDVKYTSMLYSSVTVTLDQVSQGWRYVLLAVGISLLLFARVNVVSMYLLSKDVDRVKSQFIERLMSVIGLACIFESSIDMPFAIAALVTCWVIYYEEYGV